MKNIPGNFIARLLPRVVTGIVLLLIIPAAILVAPAWLFSLATMMLWLYVCFVELPHLIKSPGVRVLCATFWIGLPLLFLILLQQSANLCWLALFAVLTTSAYDTGAYFVGNLFGITKLWPAVSPGKTWQGVFGGLCCCFITILLWKFVFSASMSCMTTLALAFVISVCATIGDLAESALKRSAGVKDSGSLLPGHGGVFDRIDSLLATIVIVYFLKNYLMLIL